MFLFFSLDFTFLCPNEFRQNTFKQQIWLFIKIKEKKNPFLSWSSELTAGGEKGFIEVDLKWHELARKIYFLTIFGFLIKICFPSILI